MLSSQYLSVFSSNVGKCGKNADQNNSKYGHFFSPYSVRMRENANADQNNSEYGYFLCSAKSISQIVHCQKSRLRILDTCGESHALYLTNSSYEEKNTVFACFKTYINNPYRLALSSNDIISYVAQRQHFRDAPVVINLFFKHYINLTVSPSYFHQCSQFYQNVCASFMLLYFMEFFLEMFVFVSLFLLLLLFSLFTFDFISGQNFLSNSKDTIAATTAVELIIRTTTDTFPAAKIPKEGFRKVFNVQTTFQQL